VMEIVAIVGVLTALMAASIGLVQYDIKRVLAYSTVSQLGYMFTAMGVGAFSAGAFHLMTHAFFKALLFLGSGSVIHAMGGEQDMRRMGNLRKYMPYTYLTFLAGWLALCGIIPFSGFWSKDEILWNSASTRFIPVVWLVWIVGTIAATCTAFYMTRLVAMTFWGKEKFLNSHDHTAEHEVHNYDHETPQHHTHIPHESPASMWVPLAVLAVLATIGGFVGINTAFTGGKHIGGRMNIVNFMDPIIWNPITRHFGHEEMLNSPGKPAEGEQRARAEVVTAETEVTEVASRHGEEGFNLAHAVESKLHSETATEWLFIVISLLVAGIGIGLGFLFYVKDTRLPDIWAARLKPLYQASYNKYWVDEFFGWAVTRRVMDAARGVFAVDSKVIDGGVNGSAWLTRLSSRITGGIDQYFVDGVVNAIAAFIARLMSPLFRAAQTGFAQNYALVMVLGLVAAVALFFGADIARAVKSVFALGL
jgi:NADH-quinone oxidoreductase subunit L